MLDAMSDAPVSLVRIRGLRHAQSERVLFDGIDIDIPRGKVTAIMGPSGTGKTTLLRLIGGQLRAQEGRVFFDGTEVGSASRRSLFALRKRMGMLFQQGALLTDLSVFDNVAFPLREHTRLGARQIRDQVLLKLEVVGLRGAAHLFPAQLSGGMARRVALARAIALDPELVLYDEPFTGQDPISMGVLLRLIRQLNDALGTTSVLVSHDVGETLSIADYAYVLSHGQLRAAGSAAAVRDSEDARVRQFLDGLPDGPEPFHYPAPALRDTLLEKPE